MENPYQAPNSRIDAPSPAITRLASRGSRLSAALLDTLIMMAVILPLEFVTGFWQQIMEDASRHEHVSFATSFVWVIVGILVFVVIQGYPLVKDAQTWGKKAASIKIDSLDGGRASIKQLASRYGFYMLLGAIPFVGPIISTINILFIFREDRRCGHDLIAGTRVVTA